MLKGIVLIIFGLASTFVLAFASYRSESQVVRGLFVTALLAAAGIIVYSGVENIRSDRDSRLLQEKVKSHEPFKISDNDKVALYEVAKHAVVLEKEGGGEPS